MRLRGRNRIFNIAVLLCAISGAVWSQAPAPLRPPAVPLVVHDPYFSIWSMADHLTDAPTKHWTGTDQPLSGLIRVDDATYRFLGSQARNARTQLLEQTELRVTPTRTRYGFVGGGIRLDLTFFTPAFPDDLDVLSRPASYVIMSVRSTDGRPHQTSVYFDASTQIAVNTPDQRITWSRIKLGNMEVLRAGTIDQPVLAKSGDNLRIDWGYLYLAAPPGQGPAEMRVSSIQAQRSFAEAGRLPDSDELEPATLYPRAMPVLAATLDFGSVAATPVSRYVVLAYDDIFSIEYFERKLRPYWRRSGMGIDGLLTAAIRDYQKLLERAERFDNELTSDLIRAGGPKYAALANLAYRQTLAAHKLVADFDGKPLYFSKENFSNGSIDTVDVTYPSSPFFLLLNPRLLEGQLVPVFDYASMPRWPWPYAPHDLGRYPLANGQGYGGGEKSEENQMPVEESGNMLLMTAALAKAEASPQLAGRYWPLLSKWARYLRDKGLDPENQLSTDDFAGHLAHNTNLSLKAILALRAYAELARMLGKNPEADEYFSFTRSLPSKWMQMADDGDHYRLAFDKPGTWSQKYNLVWDKLLGYHMFPEEVSEKEFAFYKTKQNKYGLPLDNRKTYTKLDWILWTATLGSPGDFEALVTPAYLFANESASRVPLTDWYDTVTGRQQGFQARSVVGGLFAKMLADQVIWKKYSARGLVPSRP